MTKVDPEARATSSEPNFAGQTGFSRLSIAGVEQIKDSRRARFDFRDLTLTNTDAGLPVDHNRDVIIGGAGKPEIELTWALKPRPRAHVSKESRRWQGQMEPGLGCIGPTGLIIDMNASIKNGVQVFQYYVHLNPLTYNPENIESIRATGISHRPVS